MKLASKISMLDRIVSDLKANKRDPFEQLSPRERKVVEEYERNTEPMQQWLDVIDGRNPTAALLESVGLNSNCTELEAREAYERELALFDKCYKRRNLLRKGYK